MPHTYKAFGRQIWRDGKPFAVLASVAHGTEDLRDDFGDGMIQVIEALHDCERRLTYLVERDGHKLLDVVARDKARAALQTIGAI